MNEALCRQHGIITRHDNSRLSASPKTMRRADPPSYHQFFINSSHPIAYSFDKYQVKHQRGHSAHELPKDEFIEVCFFN